VSPRAATLCLLLAGCAGAGGAAHPAASPARPAAGSPPGGAAGGAAAEPGPPSPRTQRLFAEAVQAEEDQKKAKVPTDWPLLERRWRAVLEEVDLPEARYNLGVTLEAQGRLGEARAEYEKARAARPSLRQASVNLGVLQEKEGDPRGAQAAYAAVLRDFPDEARARERLAALYLSTGQLDEAWRFAREALLQDPRAMGAYKILVRVAMERKNLDLAHLVALRAQKLDPADPELPWLMGQVLEGQGDGAGAEVQWRKALSLQEGFLPARASLLQAALRKQAWGAVVEHSEALLRADPRNAPAELVHGIALRHQERPDEALAAYARAEQAGGGKLPEVHLARGILYLRVKNECAPALEEFRAYAREAGPVATTSSPVLKLERECEQALEESRRAAEAAREMQAEAARKAEAAKQAGGEAPGAAGSPPAPAPPR